MSKPLIWNSLNDAAKWLSNSTKEEWTINRIISFCIDDLERNKRSGVHRSALIKVGLPRNIRVGIYRYRVNSDEIYKGKVFQEVAGGNLVKLGEQGSNFFASLYILNLYELFYHHETEITAISHGEESFSDGHFELIEPITTPSFDELENIVSCCGGKLPGEIVSSFGCPLRVTIDMVGVKGSELEGILRSCRKTNEAITDIKPPRKHETPDLVALDKAIQEFWEGHDPDCPPKKETVVAWLVEQGISKRIAESMDTIMRTPEARIGGNKPRAPKNK